MFKCNCLEWLSGGSTHTLGFVRNCACVCICTFSQGKYIFLRGLPKASVQVLPSLEPVRVYGMEPFLCPGWVDYYSRVWGGRLLGTCWCLSTGPWASGPTSSWWLLSGLMLDAEDSLLAVQEPMAVVLGSFKKLAPGVLSDFYCGGTELS